MVEQIDFVSKRQKKSKETKERIITTSVQLIKKYGVEYLTVKNICTAASISNGTFFHFFKTKDELLEFYFCSELSSLMLRSKSFTQSGTFFENIIRFYVCFARHCENIGVPFTKYYYSVARRNNSFCVKKDYFNIFNATINELKFAKDSGYLIDGADIVTIAREIRMIVNGIIFEWCILKGELDVQTFTRKMLTIYLKNVLKTKYVNMFASNRHFTLHS